MLRIEQEANEFSFIYKATGEKAVVNGRTGWEDMATFRNDYLDHDGPIFPLKYFQETFNKTEGLGAVYPSNGDLELNYDEYVYRILDIAAPPTASGKVALTHLLFEFAREIEKKTLDRHNIITVGV